MYILWVYGWNLYIIYNSRVHHELVSPFGKLRVPMKSLTKNQGRHFEKQPLPAKTKIIRFSKRQLSHSFPLQIHIFSWFDLRRWWGDRNVQSNMCHGSRNSFGPSPWHLYVLCPCHLEEKTQISAIFCTQLGLRLQPVQPQRWNYVITDHVFQSCNYMHRSHHPIKPI